MAAILVMYPWGSVKVLSRRGRCCIRHSESSFLLGRSGGASDQTVASPPLALRPGRGLFDFLEEWGEKGGANKRGDHGNCQKSSLRTISVRGFYFLFPIPSYPLPPSSKRQKFVCESWYIWNGGNIGRIHRF